MAKHVHNVGTMLLEDGLLTETQLEDAIASQEESGLPLVSVLLDEGLVEEADLMKAVARRLGIEYVDLSEVTVDPAAASLVPENLSNRYTALPYAFDEGRLVVAMADPGNVLAVDDIRAVSGRAVSIVAATKLDIADAARRAARFDDSVSDLADLALADEGAELEDVGTLEEAAEDAPVVKLMNTIIARAVNERASDIHVEPGERDLRIRFRIDGVLHEVMTTSRSISNAVVSRIKIMADLDIAERRVPQDGRVSMRVGVRPIDLRVATLPSMYGEKVVMRILDKSAGVVSLDDLGFLPYNLERYREAYSKPYGAILVTGPTGSGKTTTLYSTLDILNEPEVNIITVEDPVEYRLDGVTQIQVNRKAGLLFATALKSILRADPDIVLIGEVRDGETAAIAVEAALTGHLVLSTLHTNDAPSSINRLIDMGVEPFLVSSAIDAVLAQRLARVLCEKCKEAYTPEVVALERIGWEDGLEDGAPVLYRPVGCRTCSNTGYRGRIALNEVMPISEELQRLTVKRRSSEDMRNTAIEQGMRTLRQDGLAKVALGVTSIEEVLRVVI
jgi:type IV pilus assembly protein PilB